MSLFLPNPCLLGIILVISTHNGPQFVYHYPPKPNEYGYKATPLVSQKDESDIDSVSSSSESESSDELSDGEISTNRSSTTSANTNTGRRFLSGKALLDYLDEQDKKKKYKSNKKKTLMKLIESSNETKTTTDSSTRSPATQKSSINDNSSKLKSVFGFETSFLAEMLVPPKQMCNKKFELSIDGMVFLGLPIHSFDDGSWRRNESKSKKSKSKKSRSRSQFNSSVAGESSKLENSIATLKLEDSPSAIDDTEDSLNETPNSTLKNIIVEEEESFNCPMSMFHVVFVMNPPVLEYNYRILEMFRYVVSRLSIVLRYEQSKNNYIWEQANLIHQLKEENTDINLDDLSDLIKLKSSLAKALVDCYESIANANIANIEINGKLRSFQIPIKTEFSSLPPATTTVLPGSHLSSITHLNDVVVEDSDTLEFQDEMIHFALLLLDDPESIVGDIQAEKNSVLADFIRTIKPTESLLKLSSLSGFDIKQIESFAYHLIYWRRARAIPPLSTRCLYIVSPMAPISNLRNDITTFKNQFSSLPSLPTFLSLLSKPRIFSGVIPSKDHREPYLEALAWLIRYGYVTQLHTFMWLKISSQIKMKVEEELENEGMKKNANKKTNDSSTDNSSKKIATDSSTDNSTKPAIEKEEGHKSPEEDADVIYEEETDTIILEPERATPLERRWIAKCIEGKSPELTALFYRLVKYMNGKNAMEMFLIKENISRQEFKKLRNAIDTHLIYGRHW